MKKTIVILTGVLLSVGAQITLAQNTPLEKGHFFLSLEQKNIPAEHVENYLAEWLDVPAETEWRELDRSTDQLGMTRIEYRQFVEGVEVAHSQVIIHVKDGKVTTANGTVMEDSEMPAVRHRSPMMFKKAMSPDKMAQEVCLFNTPQGYRYVTKALSGKGEWIYTDVETNEEVAREPLIHHFDDGEPVTLKASGLYLGEVNISATKSADHYSLYDPQRRIYTISANKIPSLQQLYAQGTLGDYFSVDSSFPANPTQGDFDNLAKGFSSESHDYTNYILLGGTVNSSDGTFCDYRVKSIHVDRMTGTDPQGKSYDFFDQKGHNMVRIQIFYGETESALYDGVYIISGSSLQLDNMQEMCRLLPNDGARLVLSAAKAMTEENAADEPAFFYRQYIMRVVPDESGQAEWENDDIKLTLTYEKSTVSPVVDIHAGMARAYDYYKNVYGRDSYDGKGTPIYNLAYLPDDTSMMDLVSLGDESLDDDDDNDGDFFLSNTVDENYNVIDFHLSESYVYQSSSMNAFAYSGRKPYVMMYGMGGTSSTSNMRPFTELSILCHEYTHLVTSMTGKLNTVNDETLALNESFSDIMSISMVRTDEYGYGKDEPWLMGGHGMTEGFSNMRDMSNPANSKDGTIPGPDTYKGDNWYSSDSPILNRDAPHINCSVQNFFYYLLCEGGEGTNDNGYSYQLTGIGMEKGRQIAYRTLTQYATETSFYADIRRVFIQAAKDLYGDGTEADAVAKAWDAVGVYDGDNPPSGISDICEDAATDGMWYDLQGRRVNHPTHGLYIKNGHKMVIK